MNLVVDCVMFGLQSHGGIPRIFKEVLPRVCDLDPGLSILLLKTNRPRQALPEHAAIVQRSVPAVERYLRPQSLWQPLLPRARNMIERLWIGNGKNQIWHSTYFTLPDSWSGWSIVTVYDMIYEKYPAWSNHPGRDQILARKKRCIQAGDLVICISETTRQDLLEFYNLDPHKVRVTLMAPSEAFARVPQPRRLPGLPDGQPFLLYVGLRGHYKNFMTLLQAYAAWPGRQDVLLVVAGSAWTAEESSFLAAHGLQGRVVLLTEIDDAALCSLYNQALAFVHPSLYEGFGIPLLEAMACGCPVVASAIPSTFEVAGDCVAYFDPMEAASLAAALDEVLDRDMTAQRVTAGLMRAQQFSWLETARQTLAAYHAIAP